MAATWVGSVLRWAGIGANGESGKLSGAPEDEATRKAIAYGSAIDSAGQFVTQKTTLGLPSAWACISLKSELVGSMGCGVYSKSDNGGRRSESGHWLYDLLHEEPNADQTPAEFWAGQVAAMDLHGNAYAEKETLGGRVTALTPLPPHLMQVVRDSNNQRVFLYADRGKVERLPADIRLSHPHVCDSDALVEALFHQTSLIVEYLLPLWRHGRRVIEVDIYLAGLRRTACRCQQGDDPENLNSHF